MREEGAGRGVQPEFHFVAVAAVLDCSDKEIESFMSEPDRGSEAAFVADADGCDVLDVWKSIWCTGCFTYQRLRASF